MSVLKSHFGLRYYGSDPSEYVCLRMHSPQPREYITLRIKLKHIVVLRYQRSYNTQSCNSALVPYSFISINNNNRRMNRKDLFGILFPIILIIALIASHRRRT